MAELEALTWNQLNEVLDWYDLDLSVRLGGHVVPAAAVVEILTRLGARLGLSVADLARLLGGDR